ncbi:MAG: hypothetical protein J0I47_14010 [Sphingomonas sp.]|uniref:hypothetical protein n=1 Tax=Sphingomonas sp. TaxID=28214 RepID=UPI001AD4831F|nr:hypothetical protein [Sphingomonas sp.]MBN8809333.1 hypothetical protein [Sphingomonas sp.]
MFKPFPLAIVAAAAVSTAAIAAGPLQVTSKILAEHRARAADGTTSETLVAAAKVVPGTRVVFVLEYRNTGRQPLANIVFDNPVPRGIAYRGPAPNSPAPEVSVDGKTYGALAALSVRTPAGARPAGPDDVTHVRWRLARPLAPGAQGQFAFQAVLK